VLTVGVDLAAEPATTAVAWLDWLPAGVTVRNLVVGADDELVIRAIREADKAGIDCPLGWPDKFVAFVGAHQAGNVVVPEEVAGRDWRRTLAFRVTDDVVRHATGLVPLSVAADRIGHTAMRCAGLLARLAREGQPVDRSGAGAVVEVYPAASLHRWRLPHRGYKGRANVTRLATVVDLLLAAAAWLTLGRYDDTCRRSADALDAVIAALTARAAARGLVTSPTPEHAVIARNEGWIALPTCPLSALWP
jgi:predicted nuclease with RNAse H fold